MKTDDKQNYNRRISGEVTVRGDVKANLSPDLVDEYKSSSRAETRRENWRFIVEVITLLFVACVAVLTFIQSRQAIKSADAAKSSADTSKEALRVTERAYVVNGLASLDITRKYLTFPLLNTGHLPASNVEVTVYVLTANTDVRANTNGLSMTIPTSDIVDFGKSVFGFPHIAPGTPAMIMTALNHLDLAKIYAAQQENIIAGFATYNDGFQDTPRQRWTFCINSVLQTATGGATFSDCDFDKYSATFERLDKIKKTEQHQ